MMRLEAVRPTAVVATNYARRLVHEIQRSLEMLLWVRRGLADARQSLEHIRQVRDQMPDPASPNADRRREQSQRFIDSAISSARRGVSSWRNSLAPMRARLSRTVAGLDALFDDLSPRGCRIVLKLLIDDHEPTLMGDHEPTSWEAFTVCSIAKRVLFALRETESYAPEASDLDEIGIEAELNHAIPILDAAILAAQVADRDGRFDIDAMRRLDFALKRDQVTLGAAADESEPDNNRLSLRYFAAELIATGAEWPGGSINRRPVRLAGMTPEAESRLRQIIRHAEPHLRAMCADLTTGEIDDNVERAIEWFSSREDANSLPTEPFAFLAAAVSCFVGRIAQPERGESKSAETPAADKPKKRPTDRTQSGHSRKIFKPRGKVNQDLWTFYKRNKFRLAKGVDKIEIVHEFCRTKQISIGKANAFIRNIHRWEKGVKSDE